MATTTALSQLKINYLTPEQYQAALDAGTINDNEFYITSFSDGGGYLLLAGGNVTGPVNFGDSVEIDELTVGDLVVNGKTTFANSTVGTLTAGGWNNQTQSINAANVTSDATIIVSPTPASYANYVAARIICTAQGSGTLTFTCSTTPTAAIDVNVLIIG